MSNFAKIFEVEGNQVLVRKSINTDNKKEELVTSTYINGLELEMAVGNFEKHSSTIEEAFEKADQKTAERFYKTMKQLAN